MGNSSSRSPLRALAHYIVNAESTKYDRPYIVDLILRRRYGVDEVNLDKVDPVEGVLRYLAEEPNLLRALKHLVDSRRTWASLANEIAGDTTYAFCNLDAELSTAMEKVVQALAEKEGLQIQ